MARLELRPIRYADLNSRQQENYNFQKLSAVLADYGFVTMRLSDDWHGADFIAQHVDGQTFIRVQLKGRLSFRKTYQGKDLYVAFRTEEEWYLYPHDEVLQEVLALTGIRDTVSWDERGGYSFPGIPRVLRPILEPYRVPRAA